MVSLFEPHTDLIRKGGRRRARRVASGLSLSGFAVHSPPTRLHRLSMASFGSHSRQVNSNGSTSVTAASPGWRRSIEPMRSVAAWSFSAYPTEHGSSRSGTSECRE